MRSSAQLDGDVNRATFRHALRHVERVDEVEAFEALHHEVRRSILQLAKVVDVDDVLVADPRRALGFAPETRQHLGVLGVLPSKHLDRERLVEAGMGDPIDQPHASLPKQRFDPVPLIDRPAEQPLGRLRDSGVRRAHLRVVKPSRTI
ncbi:MAG: hypothetical protein JRE82_16715 [Deltaproteobacteria bacterium]|nr:hypothetical protein [Deltaproteobacteria bacterium]